MVHITSGPACHLDCLSLNGRAAQGLWTQDYASKHSNVRELLAILLTLKSFSSQLKDQTVQIQTDNIVAAAYINFQGGP